LFIDCHGRVLSAVLLKKWWWWWWWWSLGWAFHTIWS